LPGINSGKTTSVFADLFGLSRLPRFLRGHPERGSFYLDHHFTKRFDAYAGIAYSWVSGGLGIAILMAPESL